MQEKLQIGNLEVISLMDMVPPPRSPDDFFPDVDIALWDPYKDEVLDKGLFQLYYYVMKVWLRLYDLVISTILVILATLYVFLMSLR